MLALVLSLMLTGPEEDYSAVVSGFARRFNCEIQTVYETTEADHRFVQLTCPGSRVGLLFQRTGDKWAILGRIFTAPLVPVTGSDTGI